MATWQFSFHLIPASSVDRHFRATPVTLGDQEYDAGSWWDEFRQGAKFEDDLTQLLPAATSWHRGTHMWGEYEGDRVEISFDGDTIADVFVRIDMRELSLPFLGRLLNIVRSHGLLIVTEDRHVLRPSMKELLGAVHRSRSFAFVSDPTAFLNRLEESD